MSPTGPGAGGFGSGFFEPMGENRLGMPRGPAVGQHFFQSRGVRIQAEQEVADVDPGLDAMTLGAREDRVQHGGSRTRGFAAQEEPENECSSQFRQAGVTFSAHGPFGPRPSVYDTRCPSWSSS